MEQEKFLESATTNYVFGAPLLLGEGLGRGHRTPRKQIKNCHTG